MRRAPSTLAIPFETRFSLYVWNVPTTGSEVPSVTHHGASGASGSCTWTTS